MRAIRRKKDRHQYIDSVDVVFVARKGCRGGKEVAFVEGAVTFVEGAVVFVEGAVTLVGGAVVEGAVTFIGGAVTFVEGAVTFVDKGSSAIRGRSFKAAGVANDIEGVDGRDLRRRLMIYELKGPSLLMNSLISASDHSVGLSSWAMSYSACGTDLLF